MLTRLILKEPRWIVPPPPKAMNPVFELAEMLIMSSQFKHSPRAFDVDGFNLSENTDEYSICMTLNFGA